MGTNNIQNQETKQNAIIRYFSIISFVLGIVPFLALFGNIVDDSEVNFVFLLLLSTIGIITGFIGWKKKNFSKLAISGIILNVIVFSLCGFILYLSFTPGSCVYGGC